LLTTTIPRAPLIDAWRGIACILMIFYHFCYDLNYLQIISFDFYHAPFWLGLRFLIVTLFIGIAGISLHFATVNGIRLPKIIQRTMILLSCALLISLISWFLFQKRFIFFGILHFMTVASLLGLLFRKQFWLNLMGGGGFIIRWRNGATSYFQSSLAPMAGINDLQTTHRRLCPLITLVWHFLTWNGGGTIWIDSLPSLSPPCQFNSKAGGISLVRTT
jgi:hypothetical protein